MGTVDEAHVVHLLDMFPDCTRTHIEQTLVRFNNNVSRCADWLLFNPEPSHAYPETSSDSTALVPYGPHPLDSIDVPEVREGPRPPVRDGSSGGQRSTPVEVVDLTGGSGAGRSPGKRQREEDEQLQRALQLSKSEMEDANMQKAISESIAEQNSQATETAMMLYRLGQDVPADPRDNVRIEGMPAGLMNCGNTCYFNALVQIFFSLTDLRNCVLTIDPKEIAATASDMASREAQQARFLLELQQLFAFLALTGRRYIDPSGLLRAIVGDTGQPIAIGDQQDVIEFNDVFVKRAEEAFARIPGCSGADNPIKRLFYGNTTVSVAWEDASGAPQSSAMSEEFLHIIAPVEGCATVYDSLDHFAGVSEIDAFETPDGVRTRARREVWLQSAPPILMVQLQRVRYNAQVGIAEKLHTPIAFPRQLSLERYSVARQAKARECRARADALKQQRDRLRGWLHGYTNFQGCGVSIHEVLRMSASFVACNSIEGSCVNLEAPSEESAAMQRWLLEHAEHCDARVRELTEELAAVENAIEHSFDELLADPYELRGVLVHDGQAGTGHYWAYICDSVGQWRKFNDTTVSIVTEEEVYRESRGGHRNASAYCIVYVDRNREGTPMQVCEQLAAVVQADNAKMREELAALQPRGDVPGAEASAADPLSFVDTSSFPEPMDIQTFSQMEALASPPQLAGGAPDVPAVPPLPADYGAKAAQEHARSHEPVGQEPPSKARRVGPRPLLVPIPRSHIDPTRWQQELRRDVARYTRLGHDSNPSTLLAGLPVYALLWERGGGSQTPLFLRTVVEGLVVRDAGVPTAQLTPEQVAYYEGLCAEARIPFESNRPPMFDTVRRAFRKCQKAALHFVKGIEAVERGGSHVDFCHAFHAARYNVQLLLDGAPCLPMECFGAFLGRSTKSLLAGARAVLWDGGEFAVSDRTEAIGGVTLAVRVVRLFVTVVSSSVVVGGGAVFDAAYLEDLQNEWIEIAMRLQEDPAVADAVRPLVESLVDTGTGDPEVALAGEGGAGASFGRLARAAGVPKVLNSTDADAALEKFDPEQLSLAYKEAVKTFGALFGAGVA